MTLRPIDGGRTRRETREMPATEAARTANATMALIEAGLFSASARAVVHALDAGAPDAFARAYACASGAFSVAAFRGWVVTHGYASVLTDNTSERVDACDTCDKPITPRMRIGKAVRIGNTVRLRCVPCDAQVGQMADLGSAAVVS